MLFRSVSQSRYFGVTAKRVLEEAGQGSAQIWGIEEKGVIVTELIKHPEGVELFVRGFEGDVIRNIRTVHKELVEIAKGFGARWLGGSAANPRLVSLFEKLNERVICTRMVMEV